MKNIGIVALSGNIDKDKLKKATLNLKNLGYNVKLPKNIYDTNSYLAGTDEDKLNSLYKVLVDTDIDTIIAARGGYGAIRLLNKLDFDLIKKNKKIFCGFSDFTAIILMIYKKTGIITYHGPMLTTDFEEINDFTYKNFLKAISGDSLNFEGNKIYKKGTAEGIIWGGNLSTVVSLCGQDFLPNKNFIFFTEDLNEPVYKIDKMFQQLINITEFRNKCKAIVLGDFLDTDNDEWLEKYFYELGNILNIPVIGGFKITHSKDKITIPIGRKCFLKDTKLVID